MQNIINYDDKVALYENSGIADINKVNASDMNEIKSIVNGSLQGTNAMGSIVVDDVNCKNLFDFSLVNKSYSSNGITFTNNGDGTFTANGTATAVSYWDIITNMQGTGYYTLSGCPAGGSNTSYMQILMRYSDYNGVDDTGSGATREFTSGTNYGIRLRIASGYVCNNVVFRPMIEKGQTVSTYTPYKKIIKEENGYVKENTTFYANDFKCKNICDIATVQIGKQWNGGSDANTATVFVPVLPSTQYTISYENNLFTDNYLIEKNGAGDTTAVVSAVAITSPTTRTTNANTHYLAISFYKSSGAITQSDFTNFKIQVELGNTNTNIVPYKNFENEEIYSTNEMVVGNWLGKPLYRRVITATPNVAQGTTSSSFDINIANVDEVFIKDMTKIADTSSSGYVYSFPFVTGTIFIGGYIGVTSTKLVFNVRKTNNIGLYAMRIVLEYTKTTD